MKAMNSKKIFTWLFLLIPVMVFSQDYTSDTTTTASVKSSDQELQADAGMGQTIFYNESKRRNQKGCTLIQNPWKDRSMKVTNNGYKLVTQDEDETVKVKNEKNGTKVYYSNDFETLKYKTRKDGTISYKYTYYDNCKKVKVKKSKHGITSVVNKTELNTSDIRNNAYQAINRGVTSCQHMGH
jgi:hypothetical protein